MSKVSYLKTQLPSGPTIKLSADVIRRTADPNKPIQSVDDIELDALRVTVEDDSFEFKGAYDRRKRGKRTNFPGFDAEILELMRELRDYPEGVNLEEVEAHAEVVQIEQFFEQ